MRRNAQLLQVADPFEVPLLCRREDSLPQPPYVIFDPTPVHGVPVDDLVLRSVHRRGVQLAHRFWRLPIVWSSQAHPTHVSSLSGRAARPYPTGYAPAIRRRSRIVRLAVSRRLSACRRWLLGSSSARWGVAPSSRLAYRRTLPDPNGVVMLRMNKIRPGRVPPLPRGRWCAPNRRLLSGWHPPLSSGQSLRPR